MDDNTNICQQSSTSLSNFSDYHNNEDVTPLRNSQTITVNGKLSLDSINMKNNIDDGIFKQRPTHKKSRSSCVHALDASKRIIEDSAKKVYKFCCFVISTGNQLLHFKDLPHWMQDNDYIRYFHRPQLESFKKCFRSVFSLHSETGNIWTHIIGVIIMVICAFIILLRPTISSNGYPHYPRGLYEYLYFSIFFLCACICMTFSWMFHTLNCHSEKVHDIFAKMDYTGIALLIAGSSFPVIYYGFYCYKKLFITYLSIILTLCICSVFVSLWKVVSTPKFRPLRAGVFLTFGLSNIIPIVHIGVLFGYKYTRDAVALFNLITMGTLYVSGALLYSLRIPERYFPGKINLIFQSHQIFHVLVVIAALIHAFAICAMASYRVSIGHTC